MLQPRVHSCACTIMAPHMDLCQPSQDHPLNTISIMYPSPSCSLLYPPCTPALSPLLLTPHPAPLPPPLHPPPQVAAALQAENIPAVALHGGLGQWERENSLKEFSEGRARVLVATDVASRCVGVSGVVFWGFGGFFVGMYVCQGSGRYGHGDQARLLWIWCVCVDACLSVWVCGYVCVCGCVGVWK